MPQPNDFGLDLASRLAMHEMLLQRLFVEYMRRQPNADEALAELRQSLMSNFEPDLLNAGKANLSALQTAWVQQQSLHGKELAARFITKVAAGLSSAANRAPSDLWPMPQGNAVLCTPAPRQLTEEFPPHHATQGRPRLDRGANEKPRPREQSGLQKGAVRVWPRQLKAASAQSRAGPASATPIKWARMKVRQGHASSTTTSRPERTAKPSYPMVRSRG